MCKNIFFKKLEFFCVFLLFFVKGGVVGRTYKNGCKSFVQLQKNSSKKFVSPSRDPNHKCNLE